MHRRLLALIAAFHLGCSDSSSSESSPDGALDQLVSDATTDPSDTGAAGGSGGAPGGADGGSGDAVDGGPEEPDLGAVDGGDPGVDMGLPPDPPGCAMPGQPMRRLTRDQYVHALTDLLAMTVGDAGHQEHFWWVLEDEVPRIPSDVPLGAPGEHRGGFRRVDQAVYDEHVEVLTQIATKVGHELGQPWFTDRLTGGCNIDDDPACLPAMLRRVGRLVHRRPLTDDDVAFYVDVYRTAAADAGEPPDEDQAWRWSQRIGMRALFATLLSHPRFVYQVEFGAEPIDADAGVYALDAWELASRLAFHFWQSMPDEALLDAAADGSLLTDAGYAAQVERLYRDPKLRRSLGRFFAEWLRTDELPDPTRLNGTPVFDAFTGGEGVVDRDLRGAVIDELIDAGLYFSQTAPGSFSAFFASDLNFARHPGLAGFYGAPVWDGAAAPTPLPEAERAGLMTRVALLLSGSANTRPIFKGVRLREAILCDEVPPPPPDVMVREPELAEDATSREVVETLTEQPGTACIGCHQAFINPLGFATENFDALGRLRDRQALFNARGQVVGERPIRTDTVPQVVLGDMTPAADARDVRDQIVASGRAHACFAQQYFRFTFGRPEYAVDAEIIADLAARLRADTPLDQVLIAIAHTDAFKQRRTCVDGEAAE